MGTLAESVLAALRGFADEVSTWTNQGVLTSITDHLAQIENAVATDVHAGETAAKAVLADLYGAFHGHASTPVADAPAPEPVAQPVDATPAPAAVAVEAPATTETVVTAPAAEDPTQAPSTTTEASSAPSSTPSESTTDAAPAAQ